MKQKIETKSALNRITSKRLPYEWDLNVYRGCAHNCAYCFALYTHTYFSDNDYFGNIYAKTNLPELLDKELSKKRNKDFVINLGGVCDNYQPAEAELSLMPDIWNVLIKHRANITISTKSDLILRDIELVDKLSHVAQVNVASTITCMDDDIQKNIERGAVSSDRRFNMLKTIKDSTRASIGVHNMPILPYLTDNKENIEALCSKSSEIGANYIIQGTLNLRGETKTEYLKTLKTVYPDVYIKTLKLFSGGMYLPEDYVKKLFSWVTPIQKKYGLSSSYKSTFKFEEQLSLF